MKAKAKKPSPPAPEAAPAAPAALTLPRFSSLVRLFIYPACLLAPGAGLALGLLYVRQDDKAARNFGRLCLGLGLFGALLRMGSGGRFQGLQNAETLTQPFY
jgi:hypothetical protein